MPLLLVLLLAACGLLQDYPSGVRLFCEAPSRCPDCRAATTDAERAERATAWAGTQIHNGQARMVWEKTATFEPERRGPVLRAAAGKAGVRPCPMADLYEAAAPR
jgi:hypothetical protein